MARFISDTHSLLEVVRTNIQQIFIFTYFGKLMTALFLSRKGKLTFKALKLGII